MRTSTEQLTLALALAALLAGCGLCEAVEIRGTVRDAAGGAASIVTASELVPNVGDKVEIFFKIPGGEDEISVGSGRVSGLAADSIQVKIENATGTVTKDQLARIISENPTKRQPAPPVTVTPPTATPPPVRKPGPYVNIVPPGLITAKPGRVDGGTPAGDHIAQGMALFNAGDMDGAIAQYNEAIRLLPTSGIPYFDRACAYLRKNNYDGVIADADKALTLGLPNPADAFVIRGTARASKGDVDGAISDCNRAIKADPNHALAYNNRANDYILKRDWKSALADANKAVSLDPNLALAYYNRGFVRANTGDHDGAIADWNRAIQLQPGYQTELGRQIGISRSKLGRR